ncbi:MAG: hypothetical protein JWR37_341 [Mycobacterium sp.]|jgi:hypothetical protein|nr:hypothetical protein [Mycobacterium sp.]
MTAPEPWRDQPAPYVPPRRAPQNPNQLARDKRNQETEMGHGAGLVAPHANGRPPSEGGVYMPKCPPVDAYGRQLPRRRGEARGYPGEIVAG